MGSSRMGRRSTPTPIEHAAVCRVVDDFYSRIQHHPTLAEPFSRVTDWPEHKARLSHFWWIILGGERYRNDQYHVAAKHLPVGITETLVDDWLALFRATLGDHLTPEQAASWYEHAENIGRSIRMLAQWKPGSHSGRSRRA